MLRVFVTGCLAIALMVALPGASPAVDVDNNGIDDQLEIELAERFKPSFVMHDQNPLEPEPVEIMMHDDTKTHLDNTDLWFESYYYDASDCFHGPFCEVDWADCDNTQLSDLAYRNGHWHYGAAQYFWFNQIEFGSTSDQDGTVWQNKYLNGGDGLLHPGDYYDPKIYATVFNHGSYTIVQYWFFYPYNDWVVNHEGDWEHINVVTYEGPDGQYQIEDVEYYFHHYFLSGGNEVSQFHFVDETHPVVYVGGYSTLTCAGATGSGAVSGGSYPAPGHWTDAGFNSHLCGIPADHIDPGKYIPYRRVAVEIMPRMHRLHDDLDIDGADDAYFEANPEKAWMRANIYWGHRRTPAPGGWDMFDILDPGEGVGNVAPAGPLFQWSWRIMGEDAPDDTGKDYRAEVSSYPSPIMDNNRAIFVSALYEGEELSGHPFTVDLDGSTTSPESPFRQELADPMTVTITAPAMISGNQGVLWFSHWEDAYLDDASAQENAQRTEYVTAQTETWNAVYSPVPPVDWEDGIVEIADAPGSYLTKGQCVDASGNYFVCWESDYGDKRIVKLDQQMNPLWPQPTPFGEWEDTYCGEMVPIPDGEGGVLIVWSESNQGQRKIFVTKIDPNGNVAYWGIEGTELLVRETWKQIGQLEAYHASDGALVVTWHENVQEPDAGNELRAQRIKEVGGVPVPQWGANGTVVRQSFHCSDVRIQEAPDGGLVVYFSDWTDDQRFVRAQKVSLGGVNQWPSAGSNEGLAIVTAAELIDAEPVHGSNTLIVYHTTADNPKMRIAGLDPDGNMLWWRFMDNGEYEGDLCGGTFVGFKYGSGIFAFRYDEEYGEHYWGPMQLCTTTSYVDDISVLGISGGEYSVVWTEHTRLGYPGRDIYAQRFNNDGEILWENNGRPVDLMFTSNKPEVQVFPILGTSLTWFADSMLKGKHFHIPVGNVQVSSNCNANDPEDFIFCCPAGDATPLTVTVDFHDDEMSRDIAAEEISIEVEELIVPDAAHILFGGGGPFHATGPATVQNGYRTTIEIQHVGGWGRGQVPVLLNDEEIGQANLFVKSADLHADGVINLSDLPLFTGALHSSVGDPEYNEFADYSPYPGPVDGVINLSDLTSYVGHIGHAFPSAVAKAVAIPQHPLLELQLTEQSRIAKTNAGDDLIVFDLELSAPSSDTALEAYIDIPGGWNDRWQWTTDPSLDGLVSVAPRHDADGSDLLVLAYGLESSFTRLGSLSVSRAAYSGFKGTEPAIRAASVADPEGEIWSLRGTTRAADEMQAVSYRNHLAMAAPNPFNPTTTINYSMKAAGQVRLTVFNLRGIAVATLIDRHQAAGPHSVTWYGLDDEGSRVASGAYFYRLETEGFSETKKMLLLK